MYLRTESMTQIVGRSHWKMGARHHQSTSSQSAENRASAGLGRDDAPQAARSVRRVEQMVRLVVLQGFGTSASAGGGGDWITDQVVGSAALVTA